MATIDIFPINNIQSVLTKFQQEIIAPSKTIIRVHAGVYTQRIHLKGRNVKIFGLGTVIINNNLGAKQLGHNQTFHTATFLCEGQNIEIDNLIISNNAGLGNLVGQSIALYLNGDNISLHQCTIISYQDTLCLGPVIQINRDRTITDTPVKIKQLTTARYVFENCDIQGNIDYIFGGGSALFIRCHLYNNFNDNYESYICAPCTDRSKRFGFIFYNCQITSDGNKQNIFLGRPWREFAKAYYVNCKLEPQLLTNGWHYWGT